MAKWLTTKAWERLTPEEATAELEHLLRNCDNKGKFMQQCRHRFGGPMINVNWGKTYRSADICLDGGCEDVYGAVDLS